ncbi:uncharacterized protein EAF02_006610 [Botrytis sinoallii]|uniref:uncharacterized protein n=1 Tax=Botrytis sinoallii TaxID=1463999 RepID=UPI0019014058|nr:uncharacterized protein EAF02_006610 [Botrytis sinoallii]KAF7881922.1 hypothetical protein EAF02_006610 [Botrytis sinoallii]
MDSAYATSAYGTNMMAYDDNVRMFLENVSRQMAQPSQSRNRLSMSNGQRNMAPMRVLKPNSTNNSPRCSIKQNRRRTLMSDGSYQRQMMMLNQQQQQQQMMTTNEWESNNGLPTQMPMRSNRPVSWHPSTQQQMYQPVQSTSGYPYSQEYYNFDASTPAVYSGYGSPDSSFSPMSMPYSEDHQDSYPFDTAPTSYPLDQAYTPELTPLENHMMSVQAPYTNNNQDPTMYSHFDWNNFAANGFEDGTAPPTPDNFLPIQHPEPTFTPEESIPYHPLSDDKPEGEELIGMGLYDTPDHSKMTLSDPQLDNYRMMSSHLLGNSYRRPEGAGKGLKLEETWQPPAEKDDDKDDEEDGEGEDEEEEEVVPERPTQLADTTTYMMGTTQPFPDFDGSYAMNYAGWI